MYPSKGGLDECDEDDKAVISKGNGIPTPEGMSAQQASSDWDSFERQSRIEPNQKKKMEIVLKIRNCLKEYEDALMRRGALFQMQPPDEVARSIVAEFFDIKKPLVNYREEKFCDARDVISVHSGADRDRLRRYTEAGFGFFFKECRPLPESWKEIKDLYYFPEDGGIARLVSIIGVLLATLLLFGSVAALNFVSPKYHGLRIGIIGAFTLAFAITVGFLTNAKRTELFGAVAAYSAALVVFSTVNIDNA